MSSPQLEEEGVLREWSPLSRFLRQVPLRVRNGIFIENVVFTCVDAEIDCIVVGTSIGSVFWYDRATHAVHTLRPNKPEPITCVSVVSSVEFMVACGDKTGVVTVFRIPKVSPDLPQNQKQQIERYTVDGLHRFPITALTWSLNGQKLFSGDSDGTVVYTEVDYSMNITRTCEIVNEKFKVVQLSYNQHKQALIIATELRCIICYHDKPNWRIAQIGLRERRSLQELGSCFFTNEANEVFIYSCRSGLRLWSSDLDGNVVHTIKFKGILEASANPVKLLRPLEMTSDPKPVEFGRLFFWRDGLFVSYSKTNMFVFDPVNARVAATLLNPATTISGAAVTPNEIFLVYKDRELVRLAYTPDIYNSSLGGIGTLASGESVSAIPKFSLSPIIGSPFPSFAVISRVKPPKSDLPNEVVYGTESTALLPPVKALHDGIPELRIDMRQDENFDVDRNTKKTNKEFKSVNIKDFEEKIKNEVYCNAELPALVDYGGFTNGIVELPLDLRPDTRPTEAIVEELMKKEEFVDLAVSSFISDMSSLSDIEAVIETSDSIQNSCYEVLEECKMSDDEGEEPEEETCENAEIEETSEIHIEEETLPSECGVDEQSSDLIPGSLPILVGGGQLEEPYENDVATLPTESYSMEETFPPTQVVFQNLTDEWIEMSCPDRPAWLCPYDDGMVMCSFGFHAYYCDGHQWNRLPYEARFLAVSPNGQMGAKINCATAFYSSDWKSKDNWKPLSHNVDWIHMTNAQLWFVSHGEIYHMFYACELVDKLQCDLPVQMICSWDSNLLAVTGDHKLMKYSREQWSVLRTPFKRIKWITVGPNRLFWLMTLSDELCVTDDLVKLKNWWQVIVADLGFNHLGAIASSEKNIYIANTLNRTIVNNCTAVSAFRWIPGEIEAHVIQMTAGSVLENDGGLWIWTKGNKLIWVDSELRQRSVEKVIAPCKMVCISSSIDALWVLSEDGDVFVRQGINGFCPTGSDWKKMSLDQLDDEIQITHLSCGVDVVWACDIRGKILVTLCSQRGLSDGITPIWLDVEGGPIEGNTFTKVYVGPQSHMVWALDNAGNVYVREAIFPNIPPGLGWVHVPGIKGSQITISSLSVWVLGSDGIHKRNGITTSNFIGDFWVHIPFSCDYISVSVDERLWSVNDRRIKALTEKVFPLNEDICVEKDWTLL